MKNLSFTLFILIFSNFYALGQWTSLNSPTSVQLDAVSFISADTGFVAGADGKIFNTTDGGTNWTPLNSGITAPIFSMKFTSSLNGHACAYGTMLKTTDGGQTWTKKGVSTGYLIDLFFVNDSVGFCVGYGGVLLKTVDRGTNWSQLNSGTTSNLRSVFFIDENTGFVCPEYNEIRKTTDGGTTWTSYSSGTGRFLASLYFVDANTGYATGNATIVKTSDGGLTWSPLTINSLKFFQSIYFISPKIGYAVGGGGELAATYNGGVSWSVQTVGNFTSQLYGWYDMVFVDGVGYLSGYEGNIAKTTCSPSVGTDVQSACNAYQWLNGVTYTSSNNTAVHLMPGAAANGCDSVVLLDLTIKKVSDITTSVTGKTITANNASASYQWLNCANNYAIIPGANGQSYTPSINGSYAVQLTQNGCMDTSECVTIQMTNIQQNEFGTRFFIYPNPTRGNFIIDLGEVSPTTTVTLTDVQGKLIQRTTFDQTQTINMMLEEPAGVYLLSIESGDKKEVFRLIKAANE